jgi:transposase
MKFERRDLDLGELTAIVERAGLSAEERDKLKGALDTLAFLTGEISSKGASILRLRRMLFGASTEKTANIFPDPPTDEGSAAAGAGNEPQENSTAANKDKQRKRRPGHGRNGADSFTGAVKVCVVHGALHHGDRCPECLKGKLYTQPQPAVLVRIRGMAPLAATRYELERLRCNLCGEVFTAEPPDGVTDHKYDESATAMIALLKYGCGLPFHRIEKLQKNLGIPMPAATQWELVAAAADTLREALHAMIRQAAQGEVVHNDDTTMSLLAFGKSAFPEDEPAPERTGVYTTGIVSRTAEHDIALYFTGRRHAGENLARVLKERAAALPPPIQMCDALSHNVAGEFETIVANCIAHARRKFVEVAASFPEQSRHVLETLRQVYRHDAQARAQQMSAEHRLAYHQEHSGPLMRGLQWSLYEQLQQRKVEPNSTLGGAVNYLLKHWHKLTRFLETPGAPLDNNLCERALKKAIIHRKNSLFYKTENGAAVGDLFMSLIYTAEINKVDPFDYLVQLQRHGAEVKKAPAQWMPWNYRDALAALSAGPDPPA